MKSVWHKIHILSDKLHIPSLPNWLVGILALIFILRIPSFFEPYYYGDEMVYMTLGQGVRQGLTLYKNIHDNKPPLLYLTAAVAGNLFWFKIILAFWNLVTIVIFYKLAGFFFEKNQKAQKLATILFGLLTTLPLLEGLTINSELFMVVFTILALLMLLKKNVKSKGIFLAGVLFGLGTLFKIPAAFDAPVVVFYWLITTGLGNWKQILKNTFILMAGFATPLLITFVWYFFKGALPEYIRAAFMQNVGYLSSFRPGDVQKSFVIRNAPLLIRGLIVLIGSSILFIFRKKLSNKFILFSLWTLFAFFAITLSERPYPHYIIQAIAPISLLLATFFTEKSLEQSLTVIPLALAFFVPVYYKFWLYPTGSYYLRFINFVVHRETKAEYFSGFSGTTNRNYEIAQFLATSSKTSDRVFMWGPDSAAVYALSKRLPPIKYVVDYHILDYSSKAQEAKNIAAAPPKFIILTNNYPYSELKLLIKQKYILVNTIGNANIYSRLDFAPVK
jgi:4-amino-4-deoxy-L-arabinose transferase-like glycosyltransferase